MTTPPVEATFIIEHPTRGVLVRQERDPYGDSRNVHLGWRSRWSPVRSRTGAWRMNEVTAAWALERLDPAVREQATVLTWRDWQPVEPPNVLTPGDPPFNYELAITTATEKLERGVAEELSETVLTYDETLALLRYLRPEVVI